jgi:hypothetical protein
MAHEVHRAAAERVRAERAGGRARPVGVCWSRISAGQGAKGRRWYAWSRLLLSTAGVSDGWGRWLLTRLLTTQAEHFGGTVAELATRRDQAQIRLMQALGELGTAEQQAP